MNYKIASGKTIGILSPSSSIMPERFDAGLNILEQRGFHTVIHSQTYIGADDQTQFAGTPEEKAEALMDLYQDPDVDMIMASCGGNFAAQFLNLLDIDLIKANPKPLMGFSDTTALLASLYSQTSSAGFFGPTVQTLGRIAHLDNVFDVLSGAPDIEIPLAEATSLKEGISKPSPLFAATLSVLMSLAGTRHFPILQGHILILEDIGEELSHLDRLLWQLNELCPLSTLSGIAFGEFVDLKDTGRPLGMSFSDILRKYTNHLNIPVIMNAPVGHGNTLTPIPIGRTGILDATKQTLIFI